MHKLRVLGSLTLLLPFVALKAEERLENAARRVSRDAGVALTSAIQEQLVDSSIAKPGDIQVDVQDRVVRLSGFVDSEAVRGLAARAAEEVDGVEAVRNDLRVRSANADARASRDDTAIAARVRNELQQHADFRAARDVEVEVDEGIVQLSGFVASADEKNRAAEVVASVTGVREVRNEIVSAKR